MNNNFVRSHILEMASLAQLTYVAYNQGEEITQKNITSKLQLFLSSYNKIKFLHAPRLFNSNEKLSTVGFLLSNSNLERQFR